MTSTINPPPPASVEPVTEILHGVLVTDPYRWLEDQSFPRTRVLLEEQAADTRGYLDAIAGCDRIRKRIEELLAGEVTSESWKVGDRYSYSNRACRSQQPVISFNANAQGKQEAPTKGREMAVVSDQLQSPA